MASSIQKIIICVHLLKNLDRLRERLLDRLLEEDLPLFLPVRDRDLDLFFERFFDFFWLLLLRLLDLRGQELSAKDNCKCYIAFTYLWTSVQNWTENSPEGKPSWGLTWYQITLPYLTLPPEKMYFRKGPLCRRPKFSLENMGGYTHCLLPGPTWRWAWRAPRSPLPRLPPLPPRSRSWPRRAGAARRA